MIDNSSDRNMLSDTGEPNNLTIEKWEISPINTENECQASPRQPEPPD